MSFRNTETIPPAGSELPPARRRRNRRTIPAGASERSAFAADLARRVTPSFDFFLFTLLCGVMLGAAILFDAPALYVLAALLAPFMAPALGLGLATIIGSGTYFLQSIGGLSLGSIIVFGFGALSGWLSRLWPDTVFNQAGYHAVFSWPDFALLTVGAILTTFMLARIPGQRPLVTSVAIAYELYLPIGVAGFGLVNGMPGLWPDGLIVFLVHLAWTALVVTVTLAILGLRPLNVFGYTLATTLVLICAAALVAISGLFAAFETQTAIPPTATVTPYIAPTETIGPSPTSSSTPTRTMQPTATATITLTPEPPTSVAIVHSDQFDGAIMRDAPSFDGNIIITISNNLPVEIIPDTVNNGSNDWAHVRFTSNDRVYEGYILWTVLRMATPTPGW